MFWGKGRMNPPPFPTNNFNCNFLCLFGMFELVDICGLCLEEVIGKFEIFDGLS